MFCQLNNRYYYNKFSKLIMILNVYWNTDYGFFTLKNNHKNETSSLKIIPWNLVNIKK